jgi:hypothetical protein
MNPLSEYGIPGIIVGLSGFVMYLIKQHKEERECAEKLHREERADWKKTTERQFEDSNRVINENTNILSGLKTLLEHKK